MTERDGQSSTSSSSTDELNCILTILREDFPLSLPIYHCLQNAVNGSWGTISDVKTDVSTSVENLVVLCHVPSLVPTVPGQYETFIYSNAVEPDILRTFLRQPGHINWQAPSHCFLLTFASRKQDFLPEVLTECATQRGYQLQQEGRCRVCMYSESNLTKSAKSKLPKGLKVGQLSPDHVEYVTGGWKFSTPFTVSTLRRNIEVFPSAAIFNEVTGQPVSWAMVKAYGGIGLEHTLPEFKKKRVEKIVLRELIDQIVRNDDTPFVLIEEGNDSSYNAYKKLGFTEQRNCVFMWLKFTKRS
ncbi:uncharacterized protein [Ptychodera flava]|uniref:uncharacterized protein n=1 Tax=Ptychodera flava TaxID=63121 RepID=UPI00396A5548